MDERTFVGGEVDDSVDDTVRPSIGECDERGDHDEFVGIGEASGQRRIDRVPPGRLASDKDRPRSDQRVPVAQAAKQLLLRKIPSPEQPADCSRPQGGVVTGEAGVQGGSRCGVVVVASHNDLGARREGFWRRYGVVIVSHPGSMPSITPPPAPSRKGGSRRVVRIGLVAIIIVLVVGFVLTRIDTHDYSISPGGAQPVGPLISIPSAPTQHGTGKILLTDVLLTQLNALTWIQAELSPTTQIVPEAALVEPGVSPSQLDAQGYLDMAQSKDSARYVALTTLGYAVPATNDGAVVEAVASDAPASDALNVADIIVGANGTPVHTSCGFIRVVHDLTPGSKVALSVERASISDSGSISYAKPMTVDLTTAQRPRGDAGDVACPGVSGPSNSFLGVSIQTSVAYSFPIRIGISTPNIGGPSAGLAMTLGIMDKLSGGSLLKGRTIAATGTMSASGAVGDVGGVPQKGIAVQREGAQLFLVPVGEVGPAQSLAGRSLHAVAVRSITEALSELFKQGGSLTLADGSIERHLPSTAGS